MSDPVIRIRHLSFSIGEKPILLDVSVDIAEGEYLAVVGPNGAGKTTLVRCLDRIATGWTGSIDVAGQPISAYSQRRLARMMSYVPQSDGRVLPFTVHEFVMMGRYPHLSPFSSPGAEDERAVRETLALTGTEPFAERHIGTLSGGERQRVLIAAALAQGAKVLLLDEPTTFLDYKHCEEVAALLKRLNVESGVTIVSVTHDLNLAALSADRILALKHGRVVYIGDADDVMNNETLRAIYDKPFLFVDHPQTGRPVIVPEGAFR